ncbi:hypothetical protein R1flu_003460 [Riccia fluitans]|uniref:Transmembrane protein n=1 Tax=Riccia fluitans TaxID=41844 RepID=A0ABD1Y9N0_9MARC
MALLQLYPKLRYTQSCATKGFDISNYWRQTRSSLLCSCSSHLQWTKLTSISSCEVGSGRLQCHRGDMNIGSRSPAGNTASKENSETTMKETSISSGGVDGQFQGSPELKYDPSLGTTIFLLLVYTFLALSFVPPQMLGPLGILYPAQKMVQFSAYVVFFLHVLETIFACYLASNVDPNNVRRWAKLTAFYGFPILKHLLAVGNARKSD